MINRRNAKRLLASFPLVLQNCGVRRVFRGWIRQVPGFGRGIRGSERTGAVSHLSRTLPMVDGFLPDEIPEMTTYKLSHQSGRSLVTMRAHSAKPGAPSVVGVFFQ